MIKLAQGTPPPYIMPAPIQIYRLVRPVAGPGTSTKENETAARHPILTCRAAPCTVDVEPVTPLGRRRGSAKTEWPAVKKQNSPNSHFEIFSEMDPTSQNRELKLQLRTLKSDESNHNVLPNIFFC